MQLPNVFQTIVFPHLYLIANGEKTVWYKLEHFNRFFEICCTSKEPCLLFKIDPSRFWKEHCLYSTLTVSTNVNKLPVGWFPIL